MIKSIIKPVMQVISVLSLLSMECIATESVPLLFEKNGTSCMEITPTGPVKGGAITEGASNTPAQGVLVIEDITNTTNVAWFENEGLSLIGQYYPASAIPLTGLIIENQVTNKAVEFALDENFYTSGTSYQQLSMVAYVDGLGVYGSTGDNSNLSLDYVTISTPDGTVEGRIDKGGDNESYAFYLKDHLGSTRAVFTDDGVGNGLKRVDQYHAFGSNATANSLVSSENLREGFTGKEYEVDGAIAGESDGIGLTYFGARFYDSEVGMWTSTDPIMQFYNLYGYVGNDYSPVNGGDNTGLLFTYEGVTEKDRQDLKTKFYETRDEAIGNNPILLAVFNELETNENYILKIGSNNSGKFYMPSDEAFKRGIEHGVFGGYDNVSTFAEELLHAYIWSKMKDTKSLNWWGRDNRRLGEEVALEEYLEGYRSGVSTKSYRDEFTMFSSYKMGFFPIASYLRTWKMLLEIDPKYNGIRPDVPKYKDEPPYGQK